MNPIRQKLFDYLLGGGSLVMACLTGTAAAAPPPGGEHAVGLTEIAASGIDGKTKLPLLLWYPSRTKETELRFGHVSFAAAPDSAPAEGSFGLVVLSHGSGGSHLSHWKTAKYLASQGYFVASFVHRHDNVLDSGGGSSLEVWSSRPREWSLALDAVLDSPFGRLIDQTRIAAAGFSAGGYTALTVAGARPSSIALDRYCLNHARSDVMCVSFGMLQHLRARTEKTFDEQAERLAAWKDLRVRAVVALAPVGAALFPPEGLKDIHIPVLLLKGEKDDTLRYPNDARYLKETLGAHAEYREIAGAGHRSFLSLHTADARFPRQKTKEHADAEIRDFNRLVAEFLDRAMPLPGKTP